MKLRGDWSSLRVEFSDIYVIIYMEYGILNAKIMEFYIFYFVWENRKWKSIDEIKCNEKNLIKYRHTLILIIAQLT